MLPANLTRATKSALIDEVQRTAAELAEARSLLAAIAELGDLPRPVAAADYDQEMSLTSRFAEAQKERAIMITVAAGYTADLGVSERVLRQSARNQDLGYKAKPPRCADRDCDGDAGHEGQHFQWVPE